MIGKRKQRKIFPVGWRLEVWERIQSAAEWEAERTRVETFGPTDLIRQATIRRVEEIEALRSEAA